MILSDGARTMWIYTLTRRTVVLKSGESNDCEEDSNQSDSTPTGFFRILQVFISFPGGQSWQSCHYKL